MSQNTQKDEFNTSFNWGEFDPETYFAHNYKNAREEDLLLARWTCEAFKLVPSSGRILDVGTGPSFLPLLCSLPRAESLTVWEYGKRNIRWLKEALGADFSEPWHPFWQIVKQVFSEEKLPENFMEVLNQKISDNIIHDSIFNLSESAFDSATMFFCAESITGDMDEFRLACVKFCRSVTPGGLIVATFMKNSDGYSVGDEMFPAVSVNEVDLEEIFGNELEQLVIRSIDLSERPVRRGYEGMLFLTGIRRL